MMFIENHEVMMGKIIANFLYRHKDLIEDTEDFYGKTVQIVDYVDIDGTHTRIPVTYLVQQMILEIRP